MNAAEPSWTLRLSECRMLNRGGWGNGDVYEGERDGQQVIIKTYSDKNAVIRWIGRFLIRREYQAYRKLEGLQGIPAVFFSPRSDTLIMEKVEGERISPGRLATRGNRVVENLEHALDAMHERGIYHLDLRNRGNVLVAPDDGVWLLDFASHLHVEGGNPLSRLLKAACARFDQYGFSKWQRMQQELQSPS